jgi:hypothetical protein
VKDIPTLKAFEQAIRASAEFCSEERAKEFYAELTRDWAR